MNAFVVVVVAVIAATAPAPDIETFDPRLQAAIADYEALELERVITRVEELLFDVGVPTADRARALLLLGLTWAQLGEASTADQKLLEAFRLDVDAALPVKVPKKIQLLVDDARARVQAKKQEETTTTTTTTLSPAWIVAGSGGAATGVGLALIAIAFSLQAASDQPATTQKAASDLSAAANGTVITGATLAVAGVVVAGAGLVWAVAAPADQEPETVARLAMRPETRSWRRTRAASTSILPAQR